MEERLLAHCQYILKYAAEIQDDREVKNKLWRFDEHSYIYWPKKDRSNLSRSEREREPISSNNFPLNKDRVWRRIGDSRAISVKLSPRIARRGNPLQSQGGHGETRDQDDDI